MSALDDDEPEWAALRQPVLTAQHGYGTSAGADNSAVQHLLNDKINVGVFCFVLISLVK